MPVPHRSTELGRPGRRRGMTLIVKNCRVHPTHCLISTQVHAEKERDVRELREAPRAERPGAGAASFLMIRQFPEVAPRRALPGVLPRIPRYVT